MSSTLNPTCWLNDSALFYSQLQAAILVLRVWVCKVNKVNSLSAAYVIWSCTDLFIYFSRLALDNISFWYWIKKQTVPMNAKSMPSECNNVRRNGMLNVFRPQLWYFSFIIIKWSCFIDSRSGRDCLTFAFHYCVCLTMWPVFPQKQQQQQLSQ